MMCTENFKINAILVQIRRNTGWMPIASQLKVEDFQMGELRPRKIFDIGELRPIKNMEIGELRPINSCYNNNFHQMHFTYTRI